MLYGKLDKMRKEWERKVRWVRKVRQVTWAPQIRCVFWVRWVS